VTSANTPAIGKRVWHLISIGVSVLILAIAAFTLSRLLREIEMGKVVAEVQARRQFEPFSLPLASLQSPTLS
jgi:hypothetical protein